MPAIRFTPRSLRASNVDRINPFPIISSECHMPLPIDEAIPQIVSAVIENACVVIQAPPGAGKTTRVAPAVLNADVVRGKVLLIQPRRIAARAAACRIASELSVDVGGQVGYHVRFDNRSGKQTQLCAMTPGILLRQLQSDSTLSEIGVVVLDEFHERSLEYDLLLGLLRRIQVELRPDLRLVVMSATLDTESVCAYLDNPPVINVPGQMHPVTIKYIRMGARGRLTDQVAEKTMEAAGLHDGDVLVFLPGVGEIEQVARAIETRAIRENWEVMRLFGDMSPRDQDRVLMPCDRRKIILSTNVAETSLTIDGVRVVIDSGWARVARVDPSVGLNMLELEPISKASANQRAGRSGRTAPGVCYRIWDEATHRSRPDHLEPEILRVDLANAVLQLLDWGESEPEKFPWITQPNPAAVSSAMQLLTRIDALDNGRITKIGKQLNQFPLHPRLARMLIEGHLLKIASPTALAAAMLSERDVFDRQTRSNSRQPFTKTHRSHACDVTFRLESLAHFLRGAPANSSIRPAAARHVAKVADQLYQTMQQVLGACEDQPLVDQLPQALLAAFPDRLAKRRTASDPRGLMVGGRGVKLDSDSGVRDADLFLCIDVDAGTGDASVRQASNVAAEWLPLAHLRQSDDRFYHPTQHAIVTRRRTYWLDLIIEETPIATPLDEATAELLASNVIANWHRVLPTDDKLFSSWLNRLRWLANAMPDAGLPKMTPESLMHQLKEWCFGLRSLDEVTKLPWRNLLENLLDSKQRSLLQTQAPESFTLPSGRCVPLQYELGKPPILAARIQEFFGLKTTPRIAGGRIPLLLHLLAPNMRCHQITDDLASFWQNTYATVRKELRGRYPKHAWPENP
jgi:ATP-dependent helicase HrpB